MGSYEAMGEKRKIVFYYEESMKQLIIRIICWIHDNWDKKKINRNIEAERQW